MAVEDDTAKVVLTKEERTPILYDAKDRPLVRPVGFRGERRDTELT